MQFVLWDPTAEMLTNRYAIAEPAGPTIPLETLDVVVLPCSAIDDAGTRVGMGAGFYDRALERSAGALLIGVAFECQRLPADTRIIREVWDIGVDLVITESATIKAVDHRPRQ